MKKIISVFLALVLICVSAFAFSGCAKQAGKKFDLVLITDGAAVNDKAYNQSAWNGVKDYANENNLSCRYYQPSLEEDGTLTTETIAKYVDLAVKNGAKSIVLPGEAFAVSAYEIAPTYKDVNFILVDAFPHTASDSNYRPQSNVMSISFNALQAGFLAGYVSVLEGNTKLGYFGSANSEKSLDYGSGFVQGAGYAADQKGVPTYMDYANFDAANLNYDYSFTISPIYIKREDCKKETFKVVVENGIGSGVYTDGENVTITANPAPEGKVFDHWDTKSNTEKVKDKKVNISRKKEPQMNLLVGDCDCTITAVYADATTYPIEIKGADGATTYETVNATENSKNWISAPAAPSGMIFDHWESNNDNAIEDVNSAGTNVNVEKSGLVLKPVYVKSDKPTFDVKVVNGTGSGSYLLDDEIYITADAPKDGYMFYKWQNVDNQGLASGIAMENEYCYTTNFKMVDRYASIVETMADDGCQVIFGGGNDVSDSIFTACGNFDYRVNCFGYGFDEGSKGDCLASVVNDYGAAIKLALKDFKGGYTLNADCSNNCIYVTGKNLDEYQLDSEGNRAKDKKGNEIKNEDYNADYAKTYELLKSGKKKITKTLVPDQVFFVNYSKTLTLNYWVK